MFRRSLLVGYKLIILQSGMLSIVAGIMFATKGWSDFVAALLGGCAWIFPSLYFVHKVFTPKVKHDIKTLYKDFFWGEGLKLLLSAGLIILFKLLLPLKLGAFLLGYIVVVAASFLLPFWANIRAEK